MDEFGATDEFNRTSLAPSQLIATSMDSSDKQRSGNYLSNSSAHLIPPAGTQQSNHLLNKGGGSFKESSNHRQIDQFGAEIVTKNEKR